MCIVQFRGVVLPKAINISCAEIPEVKWHCLDIGLYVGIKIQIQKNIVFIFCDVDTWDKNKDPMPLYMRALDLVRTVVDLVSFSLGIGLTVILDTLVEPNGVSSQLVAQQPDLAPLSTAVKNATPPSKAVDNNFDKVLRLALSNVSVFRALRDLIEGITQTHVAPVTCGRAMEGIRHVIAPGLKRE